MNVERLSSMIEERVSQARREALEEAALAMEEWGDDSPQTGVFMAQEIRAIIDKETSHD